jgi:hypothetical protein
MKIFAFFCSRLRASLRRRRRPLPTETAELHNMTRSQRQVYSGLLRVGESNACTERNHPIALN